MEFFSKLPWKGIKGENERRRGRRRRRRRKLRVLLTCFFFDFLRDLVMLMLAASKGFFCMKPWEEQSWAMRKIFLISSMGAWKEVFIWLTSLETRSGIVRNSKRELKNTFNSALRVPEKLSALPKAEIKMVSSKTFRQSRGTLFLSMRSKLKGKSQWRLTNYEIVLIFWFIFCLVLIYFPFLEEPIKILW